MKIVSLFAALLILTLSPDFTLAQSTSVDSLRRAFNTVSEDSLKIKAGLSLTSLYNQNNPDSALYFAEKSYQLSKKQGDSTLRISSALNYGRIFISQGSYNRALTYILEAKELAEESGSDDYTQSEILRQLGNIYFIQYQPDEAMAFYQDALDKIEDLDMPQANAILYGNIANIYLEEGPADSALIYYTKGLRIEEEIDPQSQGVAIMHLNMGMLYDRMDSLDNAIYYSSLALDYAERNNAKRMMTYPLKVLSSVNLKLENIDAAISYADRSLSLSKELNSIYEMKDAQMNLYKAYNTLGNYEKALYHYVEYDILNDSLLNENANARLAEARSQYETEKKQQEIDILAAENKLQQSRILGISGSLGFALIGLLGFGWVYFSRKKKELELSEKDKIIAQSKKKIAEEELHNSKLKTEHLQKELSNFALHIVEKNDFLEELKKEISSIKSQVKNAELLKPINALGSRIYQNQMLNKDREEFEIQVEQASSGFFKKLEEEYPDITSQERRLAALLRLDLSSKEIAGILNIAPKSVDQSRYRLRKKLELDSNRNLNVFLNTI